jgi:hypothetical protein
MSNGLSWFRLYAEFSTDPKVQSMSEAMQRRLVMIFCLQCTDELSSLSNEEIAFALRIDDETLNETFHLFQRKGFLDKNNQIVSWNKRQYKSDKSTERVKKYREKQIDSKMKRFSNVTVTPPDTDTDKKNKEITNVISKKKIARLMPDDWKTSEERQTCYNIATTEKGMTHERTEQELDRFYNYWTGLGDNQRARKADWVKTWRNWIASPYNNKPADNRGNSQRSSGLADAMRGAKDLLNRE